MEKAMAKRNSPKAPKVPPAPAVGPDEPKAADAAAVPADLTLGTPDPAPAAPAASADPVAPAPDETKKAKSKLPESVTLAAPHGYIDDSGENHHWHPGTVVTDQKEISELMKRKAPLKGITHEG
jgi:hypothetical protein